MFLWGLFIMLAWESQHAYNIIIIIIIIIIMRNWLRLELASPNSDQTFWLTHVFSNWSDILFQKIHWLALSEQWRRNT